MMFQMFPPGGVNKKVARLPDDGVWQNMSSVWLMMANFSMLLNIKLMLHRVQCALLYATIYPLTRLQV